MLTVAGFSGHLSALNGTYQHAGDNHQKPTYKKRAELEGAQTCCVYFWDERDGDALAGWWMAPEVGGEQVWAHSSARSPQPPTRGWKVPWHAATADPNVKMEVRPAPAQGVMANNQFAGAKRAFEAAPMSQNKFQRGPGVYPGQPQRMTPAQQQQKARNLTQINGAVSNTEKAVAKLNSDEAKDSKFDLTRHVTLARSALNSAQRCIEGNLKQNYVQEVDVATQKTTLQKLEAQVTQFETQLKAEQVKKLSALKTSMVTEGKKFIEKTEKLVEKTKDAAVLFTCEMAEHIKPEDAIEAKDKTEKEAGPALEEVKTTREWIFARDRELRSFPATEVEELKKNLSELQNKLKVCEKDLNNVKMQCTAAVKKANVQLAKKKREEEVKKQQEERERVIKWNKELHGFAFQLLQLIEDATRNCTENGDEINCRKALSQIQGFKNELKKRTEMKECHAQTKNAIAGTIRKIDMNLIKINQRVTAMDSMDKDALARMAVKVSVAAVANKGETELDAYFKDFTNKGDKMNQFHFEKFIRKIGVECDCVGMLFKQACRYVGADNESLTAAEFGLHVMKVLYKATKAQALTKEEDPNSEKLVQIEPDTILHVLEGPLEVNSTIRVRVKTIHKEEKEGWMTVRTPQVMLEPFSPHYVVLQETVLTNTFELKGFKVVRRLKTGEKFRALCPPMFNSEAEMMRIHGITTEGEEAWVTVQGNRGSKMLKNEPVPVPPKKENEADEFSEDAFNAALADMAKESKMRLKGNVEEVSAAYETVVAALKKLEDMDEEDQEPSMEEVKEAVMALDEGFNKAREHSTKTAQALNSLRVELNNVESGPYSELKEDLQTFLEEVQALTQKVAELREKQRTVVTSVTTKERQRRMEREKAEQEALAAKLLEDVQPHVATVDRLLNAEKELHDKKAPSGAAPATEFSHFVTALRKDVEQFTEEGTKVQEWLVENMPTTPRGALTEAAKELVRCRSRTTALLVNLKAWVPRLTNLEKECKEKAQVELALALGDFLTKKKQDANSLFDKATEKSKDKTKLTLEGLAKVVRGLKKEIPCLQDIMKTTGASEALTKEQFALLTTVHYRCVKPTLITDVLAVNADTKRIRMLQVEEIVQAMGQHTTDDTTSVLRLKGKAHSDGVEGWVSIRGNKQSTYLQVLSYGYKVVKETVFTDIFEMENFKVLRRLKNGDVLRCLCFPKLEEKSGLWRMQASAEDGVVGWVTLKGNQGSTYLVNCDLVEKPAEEVKEEEKKEEEKKEEKAATEENKDVEMAA